MASMWPLQQSVELASWFQIFVRPALRLWFCTCLAYNVTAQPLIPVWPLYLTNHSRFPTWIEFAFINATVMGGLAQRGIFSWSLPSWQPGPVPACGLFVQGS